MEKEELQVIMGKNLRRYRRQCHLTQERLAEMAGISPSFCANLERGKKIMSVLVLKSLSSVLHVSMDSLFQVNDPEKEDRLRDIEAFLREKPTEFVKSLEKMMHLCWEEFGGEQK